MPRLLKLREPLQQQSQIQERVLREHDYKGGWDGCEPLWLCHRILDEYRELLDILMKHGDGDHLLSDDEYVEAVNKESADVSNFAMMIADRVRKGWRPPKREPCPRCQGRKWIVARGHRRAPDCPACVDEHGNSTGLSKLALLLSEPCPCVGELERYGDCGYLYGGCTKCWADGKHSDRCENCGGLGRVPKSQARKEAEA